MKTALTLGIFLMGTISYAQVKQKSSPTDEQNQLRKAQIIIMQDVADVVNASTATGDVYQELEFRVVDSLEEATYIVNGKPLTDPESLTYLLAAEKRKLKEMVISQPDEMGKRTVQIRYEKP